MSAVPKELDETALWMATFWRFLSGYFCQPSPLVSVVVMFFTFMFSCGAAAGQDAHRGGGCRLPPP